MEDQRVLLETAQQMLQKKVDKVLYLDNQIHSQIQRVNIEQDRSTSLVQTDLSRVLRSVEQLRNAFELSSIQSFRPNPAFSKLEEIIMKETANTRALLYQLLNMIKGAVENTDRSRRAQFQQNYGKRIGSTSGEGMNDPGQVTRLVESDQDESTIIGRSARTSDEQGNQQSILWRTQSSADSISTKANKCLILRALQESEHR